MPAPPIVQHWIEHEFRRALVEDEHVIDLALATLTVGIEKGDPPAETVRRVIASAVTQIAGMNVKSRGNQN